MSRPVYISRIEPEMHLWALFQKTGNYFSQRLFETLTEYADARGNCRLPLSFFAQRFNCSEKYIKSKLLALEGKGFVSLWHTKDHENVITVIGYKDQLEKILYRSITQAHTCSFPSHTSGGQA